jgi:hypothetical protein
MALARLVAAVIDKLTLTNWGAPQTTNLGVSGSNPFGRAIFRDIPCDSHGNRTTQGTVPAQKSIRSRNLFAGNAARPGPVFLPGPGRIATHSLRRFSRSDYRLLAGGVLDDGRGTGPPNPLGVPMPVVVRAGW